MSVIKHSYWLPKPIHFFLLNERDRRNRARGRRQSPKTITVQPGLEFDTYWKDLGEEGRGPTLVVYVVGIRVLKYDFLGLGKGHYHVFHNEVSSNNGRRNQRLSFSETTHEAQIKMGIADVRENLSVFLQSRYFEELRTFEVDEGKLAAALDIAVSQLLELLRGRSNPGPSLHR